MGIQILDENDNPFYDESYISVTTVTNVKRWNKTLNKYDSLQISYPMKNCSEEPIFDLTNNTNKELFNITFS